jgi:hypothetical protein
MIHQHRGDHWSNAAVAIRHRRPIRSSSASQARWVVTTASPSARARTRQADRTRRTGRHKAAESQRDDRPDGDTQVVGDRERREKNGKGRYASPRKKKKGGGGLEKRRGEKGEISRNDWLRSLQWLPLCSSPHKKMAMETA